MPGCATVKMIGKPALTDGPINGGVSEERLCGFACEAFCVRCGIFEIQRACQKPDRERGQHSRSSIASTPPFAANSLQSKSACGCGPPRGRAADALKAWFSTTQTKSSLLRPGDRSQSAPRCDTASCG